MPHLEQLNKTNHDGAGWKTPTRYGYLPNDGAVLLQCSFLYLLYFYLCLRPSIIPARPYTATVDCCCCLPPSLFIFRCLRSLCHRNIVLAFCASPLILLHLLFLSAAYFLPCAPHPPCLSSQFNTAGSRICSADAERGALVTQIISLSGLPLNPFPSLSLPRPTLLSRPPSSNPCRRSASSSKATRCSPLLPSSSHSPPRGATLLVETPSALSLPPPPPSPLLCPVYSIPTAPVSPRPPFPRLSC